MRTVSPPPPPPSEQPPWGYEGAVWGVVVVTGVEGIGICLVTRGEEGVGVVGMVTDSQQVGAGKCEIFFTGVETETDGGSGKH